MEYRYDIRSQMPRYLYHYTSISNFALIVKNRTICFNSLANMDDPDEEIGREIGRRTNIGKHLYVSCWTDEEQESIPMWNQYAGGMHGVRICLPVMPFKTYAYEEGEFGASHDIVMHIDMSKYYYEDKITFPEDVTYGPIEYTEDDSKLYPIYKEIVPTGKVVKTSDGKFIAETKTFYQLSMFGKHKRTAWEFQKEWRYLIYTIPFGMKSYKSNDGEQDEEISRRLDDESYKPVYERLFLDISDEAFAQMKVLMGPKMNQGEKYMVNCLLSQSGFNGKVDESSLKVK